MPTFTAEASLYQTGGHYRTGQPATTSTPPLIGPIHPALMAEEVIYVQGCPPGWQDIGGSCWPPPLSEGGTSEPFPDEPSESEPMKGRKGGGKGKTGPTKKRPKGPIFNPKKEGDPCNASGFINGQAVIIAEGEYKLGTLWRCCGTNTVDGSPQCISCLMGDEGNLCANGHPLT
jgi:hypothetical protein